MRVVLAALVYLIHDEVPSQRWLLGELLNRSKDPELKQEVRVMLQGLVDRSWPASVISKFTGLS